jgi:tellurite methyltransferase
VQRAIVSFRRDAEGDWVAHLECGHRQHVRHRPPFQMRAWVEDPGDRASRIGTPLECPLCDRAEMPEGLELVRTAGPFTEDTVPPALLRAHRVPAGTWGQARVLSGAVRFVSMGEQAGGRLLEAGAMHGIPPGVPHRLEPDGPVRVAIDFFRVPPADEVPDEVPVDDGPVDAGQAPDSQTGDSPADEVLGGDPACWAARVCEECGAVVGPGPHRPGCPVDQPA